MKILDDILAAFDNEQDSLNFLNFLNNSHPNIKFMTEKQFNHFIAFLYVFISVSITKISRLKLMKNRHILDLS